MKLIDSGVNFPFHLCHSFVKFCRGGGLLLFCLSALHLYAQRGLSWEIPIFHGCFMQKCPQHYNFICFLNKIIRYNWGFIAVFA